MLSSSASDGLRSPTAESSAEKCTTEVMPCSTMARSRWSGLRTSAYTNGPVPSSPGPGLRTSDATTLSLP